MRVIFMGGSGSKERKEQGENLQHFVLKREMDTAFRPTACAKN